MQIGNRTRVGRNAEQDVIPKRNAPVLQLGRDFLHLTRHCSQNLDAFDLAHNHFTGCFRFVHVYKARAYLLPHSRTQTNVSHLDEVFNVLLRQSLVVFVDLLR